MLASSLSFLPLALLAAIVDATQYDVTVGKNQQLTFVPESLAAGAGDTITYHFFSKNHAVAQSSFTDPCHILPNGFFSGFTPTTSDTVEAPTTFTITVNDTKPIWVYCAQTNGNHCQSGMVQAINAPASGNTLDAYRNAAKSASTSTAPTDLLPVGGARILHIDVGKDGLTFTPPAVPVELPRTVVQFSFNPANHSVVQSSFDDPCHPLAGGGFSSGFVPTQAKPSGVLFDIVVPDTKPLWFYCAQTAKTHCQAGMVGSINAPATGNTFDAFKAKAASASASTVPPTAPLLGLLTVNGTIITSDQGAVLDTGALDLSALGTIPPVSSNASAYVAGLAGGGPPTNYNWGPNLTTEAATLVQLLLFTDNILLAHLLDGHARLDGGAWAGLYPPTIVGAMGSMAAQALVHRSTATDCLQHYAQPVLGLCEFRLPDTLDAWLRAVSTLLLVEIGLLLDITRAVAVTDPWLVPALATSLGAKSRMAAVVDMMQSRAPAAAPREALLPAALVYNYLTDHYISSCPDSGALEKAYGSVPPPLGVKEVVRIGAGGRAVAVTVDLEAAKGELWLAWVGAWGGLQFTSVKVPEGTAEVPPEVSGHVWVVLVNKQGVKLQELNGVMVAGPELVWVSGDA